MLETIRWLNTLCASEPALHGGLLVGLLAAGTVGSVVHCGPMCGVFVLGQVSERMARLPAQRMCERRRFSNGLLLPYHLGRLTTYAGLGAAAASSTAVLGQTTWFTRLSAGLLVLGGLVFLSHTLARSLPFQLRVDYTPRFWSRLITHVAQRVQRRSWLGEYLFGVALGFLPCGFLYGALAASAAAGSSALGAAAMVSFGLGTTPLLMAVGVAGHTVGRYAASARVASVLMAGNVALLLILAWQRLS